MSRTVVAVASIVALLTACGGGAAPAPAPGSPASISASDWNTALAAAKREGSVAVVGPSGDKRDVLTQPFEKQYGIKVEYLGVSASEVGPRINAERSAGKYLQDVFVGATDASVHALLPIQALDPIDPALILPEVKDPSNWRDGAINYVGPHHEVLVMTPYLRGMVYYNTNQLKAADITSYRDLLDSKWRDKIVIDDPRRGGPGQITFLFFYLYPDLGPDFIRALAKQNPMLMNNYQQEIDQVGQGKFPLLIGTGDANALARMRQGVPINFFDPHQLKEGSELTSGDGNVSLFNRAPHPNAARVYINWLLSKDGQTAYAKANGYISARADVAPEPDQAAHLPVPGAIKTYEQRALDVQAKELPPLLKEVFG